MFRMFQRRALQWQLLLLATEWALLVGCVYAAVTLRYWTHADIQARFGSVLWPRAALVAAVLVMAMAALGLYAVHLRADWIGRVTRQAVAFVLGWFALSMLYYVFPDTYLGRGILGIALLLGYIALIAWRTVFLGFADNDLFKRRVLMLGAGLRARELYRAVRRQVGQRGFKVVGYVPLGRDPIAVPKSLLLQRGACLHEWVHQLGIDEIVVGADDKRGAVPVQDLLDCRQRGVRIIELAEFIEREAGTVKVDLASPSWLVFSNGFNNSPRRRALKRALDMLAAAVLLLVAWPFMLLTALAIRMEGSRGAPVLYRQERVGEFGRRFQMIKFRSMRTDAELDGVARWATEHDTRVTRVGRFIRKARLDELPQLWNVLRGDMSIIGPRPERPQFVADFNQRIPYYSLRHCVKPGLTGWAQLRYPYGSSLDDAAEKLKFDLFYVKNHNAAFDFAILLQTVEVVMFGRGAR